MSRQRLVRRLPAFPRPRLGPLIVWLAKRHDSPEIDAHGKEALNFQISMLIYNIVAAVFCLILICFVFLAILWVLNAVFVIIASIRASDGNSNATRSRSGSFNSSGARPRWFPSCVRNAPTPTMDDAETNQRADFHIRDTTSCESYQGVCSAACPVRLPAN